MALVKALPSLGYRALAAGGDTAKCKCVLNYRAGPKIGGRPRGCAGGSPYVTLINETGSLGGRTPHLAACLVRLMG